MTVFENLDYMVISLGSGLLVVTVLTLVVRMASLPLLLRAQRAARQRALATVGGGASPDGFSAAAVGELVLGVGGAIGLALLLLGDFVSGFDVLIQPIGIGSVGAFALARELDIPAGTAQLWLLVGGIPILALWVLLWLLTQRNLLNVRMPAGSWPSPSTRGRLVGLFLLRVVLGVFVPVGVVVAALLFQAVAVVTSWRLRSAAAPVPLQPAPYGPPSPYAQTVQSAQPVPYVPPVPASPPAQPSAHVPTQADRSAGAAPQVAYQELHPNEPRTIAGYQLLGRIGSGGMGTVYLARREGAATQVALKTIHPELLDHAELLRRFEREAEVLAMVSGAYTARVLDAGVDAGRPYLAMELLDGRPLDVHLREQGPIRSPEALRALALALAVALSGVHRLGLVHRDLKPANIMLTTAGPRLLDFGIAAIVDGTRLTRTGGGPGTLTYMAPEQFGDEPVGPTADVWAWACCVVCAAHGTSPFAATSTGAVIRRIVDTGPEPAGLEAVQALDPALAAAVGRALTADPAGRPADGAALVELLTAHQGPGHTLPDVNTVRDQITQGWRTLAL
ncbi:serine/threonine-protein kinase [Streptomyces sp. GS7]|uniref:serine/threonine-protein kinase n=1 Tax=Streptomyces sp. GS7 TaxID=2692234 RepID=UPI0013189EDE|nr:serine/threonine-protein kinase [Streptomyces sp. GS7]QHC21298.1 protein kinase [Streptomyces sp. GS7]